MADSYQYEAVAESQQWAIIPEPLPSEAALPVAIEERQSVVAAPEGSAGLSAEAIDTIARSLAPIEVPPGILTAIVGTPVFIVLLARARRIY